MKQFSSFVFLVFPVMIAFLFLDARRSCILAGEANSLMLQQKSLTLKAGFSKVKITPPVGTFMTGFGNRDRDHGCEGIHDDLFARALYITYGNEEVLIMGFDLLFFSRDEADRYKGAIGRAIDLSPRQILLNTSHTHTGPKVGTWYYTPSDPYYLNWLEQAIVQAAQEAHNAAREVTAWSGSTRTSLPMNRRMRDENGKIALSPNPEGITYTSLPMVLFKDNSGKSVSLLFSVACHPSTIKGDSRAYQISADYPGAAMDKIDAYLGTGASLFLQGAGGNSKASVIGKGQKEWRSGTWKDVDDAGAMVANEVIEGIKAGLTRIEPELITQMVNANLALTPPLSRSGYESIFKEPKTEIAMRLWAQEQMNILDRGFQLPASVPITIHGIQLGKGLRIVGIEGELVAELGLLVKDFYKNGTTFALGYSDGAQLYIPTSKMLDEGGYEVESYWEYRQPSPLAKGIEDKLTQALIQLRSLGIN